MSDLLKSQGNERTIGEGRIVELIQFDVEAGGKMRVFEKARRAPGTRLIITDGTEKILLTREYRLETGYDFRLPGGKVYDSLEEYRNALHNGTDLLGPAKEGAIREAREEAGIITDNVELFSLERCGSTMEWDLYYFIIETDLDTLDEQDLGEGEDIEVHTFSFREAFDKCKNGEMSEGRSVGVLMRYLANKLDL